MTARELQKARGGSQQLDGTGYGTVYLGRVADPKFSVDDRSRLDDTTLARHRRLKVRPFPVPDPWFWGVGVFSVLRLP
jgi:hypothetical protein